jgi:4-hydroxy-2-oxoheptanedioate aldolase
METRRLVAEVANKHGKFAATTGSIDKLPEFIDMGYKFISIGADVIGMSNYCHNLMTRFNKAGENAARKPGGENMNNSYLSA